MIQLLANVRSGEIWGLTSLITQNLGRWESLPLPLPSCFDQISPVILQMTFTVLYTNLDLLRFIYCLFLFFNTFFLKIFFFHYGLSKGIEYSSLCYTLGLCCLSILNIIVFIYQPQTPSPSLSCPPTLWQPKVCSLWVYFCSVILFLKSLLI